MEVNFVRIKLAPGSTVTTHTPLHVHTDIFSGHHGVHISTGKCKVTLGPQAAHTAGVYPSFCSMNRGS